MPDLLTVKELSFCDENNHKLLDDVNFSINTGEMVGILGANGAGKTTLMRCLFGALRNFSGTVHLNGQNTSTLHPRQRALLVAAVTQEMPADFQLSVRSVIATGRTPHQHWLTGSDPNGTAIINSAIQKFNLEIFLDRDISELSGGERKRVMICRAFVQQPQLMILDEPCNHLDIEHQLSLMELLRELPISSLISLHDFPLAARYCDRLLMLQKGRLIAQGRPDEVLTPRLFETAFNVQAKTYNNPWGQWSFHASTLPSLSKTSTQEKHHAKPNFKFSHITSKPYAA
ncbi:ABC transporter ATP-binding protein [Marinomonas sp. 2405UD68-3]|uniref:ABC transporter ATP-binding protein n=1 Tax=Marinomonas sp. 2405UD68-3 TaxID=3391835 RepID=UPI0039C940DA